MWTRLTTVGILIMLSLSDIANAESASVRMKWDDFLYIDMAEEADPVRFPLPPGITAETIERVEIHEAARPAVHRVEGAELVIEPCGVWENDLNLIELTTRAGERRDFFVCRYRGNANKVHAEDRERRIAFARREAILKGLQETVDAGYTEDPRACVTFEREAFTAGSVNGISVNGVDIPAAPVLEPGRLRITPPGQWKEGLNTIVVDLASGSSCTYYLTHYTGIVPVVYDQQTCTVGGDAFYPRAIYTVGEDQIEEVADLGINLVHNYGLAKPAPEKTRRYFDAAQRHHVRVFCHIACDAMRKGDIHAFVEKIAAFMNHPALFGWYVWDEPHPADFSSAYWEFFTHILRRVDPFHPQISSHWYVKHYADSGGMDMRQIYHGSASAAAAMLQRYERNMRRYEKMSWVAILNTHEGFWPRGMLPYSATWLSKTFSGSPQPEAEVLAFRQAHVDLVNASIEAPPFPPPPGLPLTRHQIRGQALSAIAYGSNGLFYWPYIVGKQSVDYGWYTLFNQPKSRGYFEELMNDLRRLGPFVYDPTSNSVTWRTDGFFFRQKRVGNNAMIIAVNENPHDHRFATHVHAYDDLRPGGTLQVFNEPGITAISLKQLALQDSLRKDEARVYLFKPTSSEDRDGK